MSSFRIQPISGVQYNLNKEREKQNEERRKALLLKKALIEEKRKEQLRMHEDQFKRGR